MKAAIFGACVALLVVSASADLRTWKDKTGKFSIQAELVDSDGTAVRLKKADGKIISVPISRLCDADHKFLESQEKNPFGEPDTAKGPTTTAPGLRYGWKAGREYTYRVKIEVDLGDTVLEMTGNPNYHVVSTDKDKTVLGFRGALMEHERNKSGTMPSMRGRGRMGPPTRGMGPRMRPFSPFSGVGPHGLGRGNELTVDPQGHIARQEGSSQLPFLLGNLSHLMIEPLPATDEKTWTAAHGSGVVIKDSGPPRFGPFANDEGYVPATEKTTYTVESATDKTVVIRKQYEFRAAATGSDKPPFEITGDGKWTFNKAEGVSGDLDFNMKVTFRKGGVGVEVPLKATYHLIDEAEKAAMAKAAKEKEAEAKRPLTAKETTDVVADLKSGDRARMSRAAQQLSTKTPEKPDAEVAKALMAVLGSDNAFAKGNAARALEKWSTPDDVPGLIKALGDDSPTVRSSVIKVLARHKAREAIEPIVAKLSDPFARRPAMEFLEAIGPAAEPAVVKLLENLDPAVRREAASVLKTIGTKASIPALEKAMTDPDVFVKNNAKAALAAVKNRE